MYDMSLIYMRVAVSKLQQILEIVRNHFLLWLSSWLIKTNVNNHKNRTLTVVSVPNLITNFNPYLNCINQLSF